jgi:hypothetical protein
MLEEIGEQEFSQLVLTEFPQLGEDLEGWKGLDHLQMMEFGIFTQKAAEAGDWDTVEKCLRLADAFLRLGNTQIRNGIHVTFLEGLPRHGEVQDRIKQMMTPELRRAWIDIIAYLSTLGGNNERKV